MKKITCVISILLLFLLLPVRVFAADIVINEIFANPENEDDEFVELYNITDNEINLSNWKLSDKVKEFTFIDVKISGKGFYVLEKSESGIELNNSNEELVLKDATDTEIDKFTYTSTIEGKSWSRVPDGSGSFENNTDPTKGTVNASPPTPTPTITPTPTKTPSPTRIPTPTKTPSPTKVSSALTAAPTKLLTPTDSTSETEDNDSSLSLASDFSNDIFRGSDTRDEPGAEVLGESTNKMPYLFIGLGLIFLAVCAILAYLQFGDRIKASFIKNSDSDIF